MRTGASPATAPGVDEGIVRRQAPSERGPPSDVHKEGREGRHGLDGDSDGWQRRLCVCGRMRVQLESVVESVVKVRCQWSLRAQSKYKYGLEE